MKGDLALEYIFRIVIMLVTVAVMIGLIYTFSSDIRSSIDKFLSSLFGKSAPPGTKTISQDTFSSREIATFIDSCYSSNKALPENEQKDTVCFVLLAKTSPYFNVDTNSILNNVSPSIKNQVDFKTDFTLQYVKIQYQDLGNRIIVS